jgi:hypothetical protein
MSALRQKGTVANSLWGEPDCSVVINYALAIERRGRGVAENPSCLYVQLAETNNLGIRDCSSARKNLLEPKHFWAIRAHYKSHDRGATLSSNLAIDSKLRACALVKLRLNDICSGARVRHSATIVQKKSGRPVQFEITEQSRRYVEAWLPMLRTSGSRYLFPSRLLARPHYPPVNMPGQCIAELKASP